MLKEDATEFMQVISKFLNGWKGVDVNRDLLKSWWNSFELIPHIKIADLEKALAIYNMQSGNKYNVPPNPGRILEIIIGSDEERAIKTWERFLYILELIGTDYDIDLGDPVANKTINDLGGIRKLSALEYTALTFLKKEYISLYSRNMVNFIKNPEDVGNSLIKGLKNETIRIVDAKNQLSFEEKKDLLLTA